MPLLLAEPYSFCAACTGKSEPSGVEVPSHTMQNSNGDAQQHTRLPAGKVHQGLRNTRPGE